MSDLLQSLHAHYSFCSNKAMSKETILYYIWGDYPILEMTSI